MDELDVKILRAIISESAVAPTNVQVISSLRTIAKRVGVGDMTVAKRFKKLQTAGCMDEWQLGINASLFGFKMSDVMLEVGAEYAKPDMIRKLGLVHGVLVIINFLGKGMKVTFLYDSEESRSRTVELISRITGAELLIVSRPALPASETKKLTETDVAIIQALSKDARKSTAIVARELGVSSKTVRNRLEKLRKEKTIFVFPNLNMTNIEGFIPAVLLYGYARPEAKSSVDSSFLSHFESNYLWGGFWDKERGTIVLNAPTMADVPRFVEWAKSQPGVASARVDIPLQLFSFPEKLGELLRVERLEKAVQNAILP
jgi:DNA-binding Lrp family transcriptional regulator